MPDSGTYRTISPKEMKTRLYRGYKSGKITYKQYMLKLHKLGLI